MEKVAIDSTTILKKEKATKRKFNVEESNSKTKKAKIIAIPLNFKDLPDDVLIEIIKMVPKAQWANIEIIDHQFQRAVRGAWRSIKTIRLDEDFIYTSNIHTRFENNPIRLLNSILEKLVERTPNITSICGFYEFTKNSSVTIGGGTFKLLADFKHLERINFTDVRLRLNQLAIFLKKSASRGQLKELDLSYDIGMDGERSLGSAFDEIPGHQSLKLKKLVFPKGKKTLDSPFGYVGMINVSQLTTLNFVATRWNVKNFVALLNRCDQLELLDITFMDEFDSVLFSLLRSITTLPSENLSSLKLRLHNFRYVNTNFSLEARSRILVSSFSFSLELIKLIGEIGRRYRLKEFSLLAPFLCNNNVISAIANNLFYLKALELDVMKNICDASSLTYVVTRLTDLEKLAFFGKKDHRVIGGTVISAVATNLSKLKSLYLEYPYHQGLECLNVFGELKELRIRGGEFCAGVGQRFESMELPDYIGFGTSDLSDLSKNWQNLRRLSYISSIIISKSCPLLIYLDLSFCQTMTLKGIQAIIDKCTHLTRLNLKGNTYLDIGKLKVGNRKIKFY